MSDSSPLDDPLLSETQMRWLFITFGWFGIGSLAVATDRLAFGAGTHPLGVGSSYRVYTSGWAPQSINVQPVDIGHADGLDNRGGSATERRRPDPSPPRRRRAAVR